MDDLGDVRAHRWAGRRTYAADALPALDELIARKAGRRIAVVLPARNEAATIGPICEAVHTDLAHFVDELIVIDGASTDGTAEVARAHGAEVYDQASILPEIPAVVGKGDSLWRSVAATSADVIAWIDADVRNFAPSFVTRLTAPLLLDDAVALVKAFYRRPLHDVPDEGGRVTELLARPLLHALFPELGAIAQPLAGEYAIRRDVAVRLPFRAGSSVEVGLLIDVLHAEGLDAIAQVDLGERIHRNRPLSELVPMAHEIARTILGRAVRHGRLAAAAADPGQELERPPLSTLEPDAAEA